MESYDNSIYLPHHVSQNHPQMLLRGRAAQLAPFAALTGYEAAVGETARLTSERRERDAQEAGGAYVTVTGRVRHISVPKKTLVLEDGAEIPMEDIVSMTGEIFCHI